MGSLGQAELRTRAGQPYIFLDLQEITGYTTSSDGSSDGLHINIMRERGKPRDHFEKSFCGCMVNVDGVCCRGKDGCVSCAKSN